MSEAKKLAPMDGYWLAYGPDEKLISKEEHARLQRVLKPLINDVVAQDNAMTEEEVDT